MSPYVEPTNPAQWPVYERLLKRQVPENLRAFLSPLVMIVASNVGVVPGTGLYLAGSPPDRRIR